MNDKEIKQLVFETFIDGYQNALPPDHPDKGGRINEKGRLVMGGEKQANDYVNNLNLMKESKQ